MKKAYVYGMAGLVTAAVGVTAASGLLDGSESDAGQQHAPAALASTTVAPKAAPAPPAAATPAPAPVRVVPAAPAVPAAKPAPVAKVAQPEARAAVHRPHKKKQVRPAERPRPSVVRAAAVKDRVTPRVTLPVKPITITVPAADPVANARQALDNATRAVKDAKRLVDNASKDVKHAKEELRKIEPCDGKHKPHAKQTKKVKDKPVVSGKAPVASGKAPDTRNVSVSLDSSQVKPGQSKTITKSTPDGSATSSVTVTRK